MRAEAFELMFSYCNVMDGHMNACLMLAHTLCNLSICWAKSSILQRNAASDVKFLVMCIFTWISVISSHSLSSLLLHRFSLQKQHHLLCILSQEICLFHHEIKQIFALCIERSHGGFHRTSDWFKLESLLRLRNLDRSFVIGHKSMNLLENESGVKFKMRSISNRCQIDPFILAHAQFFFFHLDSNLQRSTIRWQSV